MASLGESSATSPEYVETVATAAWYSTAAKTDRRTVLEKSLGYNQAGYDTRFVSVDRRLDQRNQILMRLERNQKTPRAQEEAVASASEEVPQFPSAPRSHIGFPFPPLVCEMSDSLSKKIAMLTFDGTSPFGWIARAERFFRICQVSEEERLSWMSLCCEGDALFWYKRELASRGFLNWCELKRRLLARFAPAKGSSRQAVKLKKKLNSQIDEEPISSCATIPLETEMTPEEDSFEEKKSQGVSDAYLAIEVEHDEKSIAQAQVSLLVLESGLSEKLLVDFETCRVFAVQKQAIAEVLDPIFVGLHSDMTQIGETSTCVQYTHSAYHVFDEMIIRGHRFWHKRKQRKCFKYWRFKFKRRRHQQVLPQPDHQLFGRKSLRTSTLLCVMEAEVEAAVIQEESKPVVVLLHASDFRFMTQGKCMVVQISADMDVCVRLRSIHDKIWCYEPTEDSEDLHKTWTPRVNSKPKQYISKGVILHDNGAERMRCLQESKLMHKIRLRLIVQSLNSNFHVKHRWKYKLIQQILKPEMNMYCVVITFADATCWLYVVKRWSFTLSSASTDWEQLKDMVNLVQFMNESKFRQAFLVNIFGDESVAKAATLMEKLQQWLLQSSLSQIYHRLKKQKFLKAWHFKYKLHGIENPIMELTQDSMMVLVLEKDRELIMLQLQGSSQRVAHIIQKVRVAHTMQKVYIEHKARTLQAISELLLRHLVGSTEAAATENSSQPSTLVQKFAARLLWLWLNGINTEIDINTEILAVLEQIMYKVQGIEYMIMAMSQDYMLTTQHKLVAALITGKRAVKVKALEAAEASKRIAGQQENDCTMKQTAMKLEQARLGQANMRKQGLEKDQMQKVIGLMAARLRHNSLLIRLNCNLLHLHVYMAYKTVDTGGHTFFSIWHRWRIRDCVQGADCLMEQCFQLEDKLHLKGRGIDRFQRLRDGREKKKEHGIKVNTDG